MHFRQPPDRPGPTTSIDLDEWSSQLGGSLWRPDEEPIIGWTVGSSPQHRLGSVLLETVTATGPLRVSWIGHPPATLPMLEWLAGRCCELNQIDPRRIEQPALPEDIFTTTARLGDTTVTGLAVRRRPVFVAVFRLDELRLVWASIDDEYRPPAFVPAVGVLERNDATRFFE
jgi:hypothetical protein